MSYIFCIVPLSASDAAVNVPGSSPGESWTEWWNGKPYLAYSVVGGLADIPDNAFYAVFKDDAGAYHVKVQAPATFVPRKTLAGWP